MSDLDKEIFDQRMRTRGYVSRQKQRTMGHETFDMPSYRTPEPASVDLNYGQSVYDPTITDISGITRIPDIRSYNQPDWLKVVNGVAKGVVTAATTAAGLAGTIWGFGQGIYSLADNDPETGFWRSMWDNPVNQCLNEINNLSEEIFPNYYSLYEQQTPFVLSANFVGDKLIKNIGFMVGAFYGGMPVGSFVGKLTNAWTRSAWTAARANRAA